MFGSLHANRLALMAVAVLILPGLTAQGSAQQEVKSSDKLYIGQDLQYSTYGSWAKEDMFYRLYPNGGFRKFSAYNLPPGRNAPASPADPFYTGTYQILSNGLVLFHYRGESIRKAIILAPGQQAKIGGLTELCTCEGLRIQGAFPADVFGVITFDAGGRFVDGGPLRYNVFAGEEPYARPGMGGTYSIADNVMTLTYANGRQVHTFFAAPVPSASAAWIKLGHMTLFRR